MGAGLHGLGMSACFIASFTLITEPGGKSVTADQVSLKPPSCTMFNYTRDQQVAMMTSLWITAENIGSFLGAVGGGAAYDRFE